MKWYMGKNLITCKALNKCREIFLRMSFPESSIGKEFACKAGDPSLIPGPGRSPGEVIGYPLQYSWASLVAQMVKNLLVTLETWFDPWIGKIPWRRA